MQFSPIARRDGESTDDTSTTADPARQEFNWRVGV
jgi:hypothetical protein